MEEIASYVNRQSRNNLLFTTKEVEGVSYVDIGRQLAEKIENHLLYNMYHPCVTESLRLSLSSVFCAKIIFLSRSCFSSSPTLLSS